ncbi:MAG: hypothetical protein ACXQT2_02070, partial [Methanotrichaceae archaeon]
MYPGGIQIDFEWIQYLNLAKELARSDNDEAKLRSSISRAYYAAFCNAKNYLEDVDHQNVPKDQAHSFVINYFKGYDEGRKKKSNRRRKIGFDLERMRNKRVMADYQRDATNNLTVLSSEAN